MGLFARKTEAAPTPAPLLAQAEDKPASPVSEPATRADIEAAVDAIGIAIREAAQGSRDSFFTLGRFYRRLGDLAERASPDVNRFLKRLLGAMQSESPREYGADRGSRRAPGQPWSTM